jgi:nucleoside-diphosphate-sugar epimerase
MKILITGGAGFKGCVIADALLDQGHEVTIFDVLRYGEGPGMGLLKRGARVVRGDVTRIEQLAPEVARHDAVIHLAALVGFPLCDAEPRLAEEVNVGGTKNLVSLMHPGQLLVYASTGSVYGRVEGLCTEDQLPTPLTLYGRTKLEAERIATDFGGVSLRFATLFGVSPCMRFDLMINAFVYRAIHIGWMVLYQADDRRSFLDVSDAADSYVFALENYAEMAGKVFNVGDPKLNLTKRDVVEAVSAHFPMRVVYEDVRADPDQRNYEVSFDRIRQLGFKSSVPLDASILAIGAAAQLSDGEGTWRFHP